ncbi:ParB/RepB/Spo0J family partition protein [Deinococcus deserti]|uniref:ParB/RepB/Spo0J family partition protein n=1 Tax=Deinococcus deserti TaxID=310783 RepID=UPI00139233A5|nr:ParB/RepB/Spo0J family partition protein [Deinococcus deserti]
MYNQRSKTILEVPLDQVVPFSGQARRYFDHDSIKALADSIEKHGQLSPLLVWRNNDEQYEIIAGERRWKALRMLKRRVALADVIMDVTRDQAFEIALVDNLQRENLNRYEEVRAKLDLIARRLMMTPDDARAELLRLRNGTSSNTQHLVIVEEVLKMAGNESLQSFVANGFPVLDLPQVLRQAVEDGSLHPSKATVIKGAPEEHHAVLIQQTVEEKLTRQQVLDRVRALAAPKGITYRSNADAVRKLLTPSRLKTLDTARRNELETLLAKVKSLLQ